MREYNGAPAHTAIVSAGTVLWRIHRTDSSYPANSFNSTGIAPLTDASTFDIRKHRTLPRQGRFDPVHDESVCPGGSSLGGYLYVGSSVGAVVAEGILRGTDVPKTKLLPYSAVVDFSLTKLVLGESISVASLDTQVGLTAINQDGSLVACTWRDYHDSRMTCTDILVRTPNADGVRYPCRHGKDELALMLIDRGGALTVDIEETSDLSAPGWGLDLVLATLESGFGLTIDLP